MRLLKLRLDPECIFLMRAQSTRARMPLYARPSVRPGKRTNSDYSKAVLENYPRKTQHLSAGIVKHTILLTIVFDQLLKTQFCCHFVCRISTSPCWQGLVASNQYLGGCFCPLGGSVFRTRRNEEWRPYHYHRLVDHNSAFRPSRTISGESLHHFPRLRTRLFS